MSPAERFAWLVKSIETWPEDVRPQIILQIEAITTAMRRDMDEGRALLDFLQLGLGRCVRNEHGGIDVVLTEKGEAAGAVLVKEMAGSKPN